MRRGYRGNNEVFLQRHLEKNLILYIITFVCICIGVILGVYSVKYMIEADGANTLSSMKDSLNLLKGKDISYSSIFFNSVNNYLSLVIILWFLGLTIVGIPFILLIDIFKGYTLGFTFSFIVGNFAMKGFGASILGVILQNLIFIPCLMFLSVIAMRFSMDLLKNRNNGMDKSTLFATLTNYSLVVVMAFGIMLLGCAMETFISPRVINYFIAFLLL